MLNSGPDSTAVLAYRLDGEDVNGIITEQLSFDASWSSHDNDYSQEDDTVARVAYTTQLAGLQLSPNNYLNSEYGDKTTANDQQTCVAYNLITSRNSLVRDVSDEGDGMTHQSLPFTVGVVFLVTASLCSEAHST